MLSLKQTSESLEGLLKHTVGAFPPDFWFHRSGVHACSDVSDTLLLHGLVQALLSMRFSRQEYWSGLSFPIPGDRPDAGTEPTFPASPALQGLL